MTRPGTSSGARWADLRLRLVSGAAMVVLGAAAVLAGGVWFQMLAVFVCAVMIWELWSMIQPGRPVPGMLLAALTASVLSGALEAGSAWFLVALVLVPAFGAAAAMRARATFAGFALAIQVAGWGLVTFRDDYGALWLLWLILVVVVTDVAGYFAGRRIGGPKVWPRVSPSKTWSGTLAGWIASAVLGYVFWTMTQADIDILWFSVWLSMAGQAGDAAESALKRRMGVKDSSALIPGHGGLFDRFDALLGASLFMLLIAVILDLRGIAF